jgi:CBS domain-containing protein
VELRTAADMMAGSLVTLSPDTDIYEAMQTLVRNRISGAPVVDRDGCLLGLLSEKDCLRVLTGQALDGLPHSRVRDYMTKAVETISLTTSLYDIVDLFLTRTYRRLPVVDETGRIVGQVSRRDVLVAIESIRDNSYLYGSREHYPVEQPGVASAMWVARGRDSD